MKPFITTIVLGLAASSCGAQSPSEGLPSICVEVWEGQHQIGGAEVTLVEDETTGMVLDRELQLSDDATEPVALRASAPEGARNGDRVEIAIHPTATSDGVVELNLFVSTRRFAGLDMPRSAVPIHLPAIADWAEQQRELLTEDWIWRRTVSDVNAPSKNGYTRISAPLVDWELHLSRCALGEK